MIQTIVFAVALGLSIWLMVSRSKKVPDGQVMQDPLTRREKVWTWILSIMNPIVAGAILYYGWKKKLPVKAKQANRISIYAFFIFLVIFAGFLWYRFKTLTPSFTSGNTIDPMVKGEIFQAIDNRYAVLTSNNATRIRTYMLRATTSSDQRAIIESASDQDILGTFNGLDLFVPPADLLTSSHADWNVASDSAEVDYYTPEGGEAIFYSVNVGGTWY